MLADKGNDLAIAAEYGEDESSGKGVAEDSFLVEVSQTCSQQSVLGITSSKSFLSKGVGSLATQTEGLCHIECERTVAEIEVKLVEMLSKLLLGISSKLEEGITLMLSLALFIRKLCLLNHDTIHVGKEPQRFRIGHLGMLHQEGDAVATLATTKTLKDISSRIDVEGTCLLVVEGTAGNIIITSPSQGEETGYNLFYMSGILNLLYGVGTNH